MFGLAAIRRGGVDTVAVIVVVANHLENEAVTARDEDAVAVRKGIVNPFLWWCARNLSAHRNYRLVVEKSAGAIAGCMNECLLRKAREVGRGGELCDLDLPAGGPRL